MIEMANVRQIPNDYFRRWFSDENFDLVAWDRPNGTLFGFQLSYDKGGVEKALTWRCDRGISHSRVDTGESSPLENRTPTLTPLEGHANMAGLLARFEHLDKEAIPADLQALVHRKIREYGGFHVPVAKHWEALLVVAAFTASFAVSKLACDKFLYGRR
jgi:hypothetical protein